MSRFKRLTGLTTLRRSRIFNKLDMRINVNSEIGRLEGVIIHTPGPEVENMTPQNAERALYSDILNLSVVNREYSQFRSVVDRFASVYEVKDLLAEVLRQPETRKTLIERICRNEDVPTINDYLGSVPVDELARQLLEGVPLVKDNLTKFLSSERYLLQPLHNFFFTRDAAVTVNDRVVLARLASKVREREALIMETIFENHPDLRVQTIRPPEDGPRTGQITLEGGDVLVARHDILIIGTGARTTTQGIDHVLDALKPTGETMHVLVQELPRDPESFIHLDMVFTLLDRDCCLIYEPVILNRHDFQTVHILIEGGAVKSIREEQDLPRALGQLGMDVRSIPCGGKTDRWTQEREQWHSGANFFAVAPGRVLGYSRNVYTLEAMSAHGFEILPARDVLEEKVDPDEYDRFAITIEGGELSRGGGGCRCMTMPIKRASVDW